MFNILYYLLSCQTPIHTVTLIYFSSIRRSCLCLKNLFYHEYDIHKYILYNIVVKINDLHMFYFYAPI